MAPLRMPTMVMPIWMVEKKTVGFRFQASAEPAPGSPRIRAQTGLARQSTRPPHRANTPLSRMSRGSRSSSIRTPRPVAGITPGTGPTVYSSLGSGASPSVAARAMMTLDRSANTKWWNGSTAYQLAEQPVGDEMGGLGEGLALQIELQPGLAGQLHLGKQQEALVRHDVGHLPEIKGIADTQGVAHPPAGPWFRP